MSKKLKLWINVSITAKSCKERVSLRISSDTISDHQMVVTVAVVALLTTCLKRGKMQAHTNYHLLEETREIKVKWRMLLLSSKEKCLISKRNQPSSLKRRRDLLRSTLRLKRNLRRKQLNLLNC